MSIDRINNKAIHDGTDYTMHSLHAVDSVLTTEIKHPNGATGLIIDENGYSVMPNRPAFYAYADSPYGNFTQNAGTVMFNKVGYNIGNYFDTSTGYFTAPVSGVYFFSSSLFNNGSQNRAAIYVNSYGTIFGQGQSNSGTDFRTSGCLFLNANDYVYVSMAYNGATIYNAAEHTVFSGCLIG